MDSKFTPEPNLLKVAEAYALDCVDFFAAKFPVRLDFSPNSIAAIEQCLEVFHVQMAAAAPKPEQIEFFSKMFGSYLGETYRRAYGGVWESAPTVNHLFNHLVGLFVFLGGECTNGLSTELRTMFSTGSSILLSMEAPMQGRLHLNHLDLHLFRQMPSGRHNFRLCPRPKVFSRGCLVDKIQTS